jgi:hypothetical protein
MRLTSGAEGPGPALSEAVGGDSWWAGSTCRWGAGERYMPRETGNMRGAAVCSSLSAADRANS